MKKASFLNKKTTKLLVLMLALAMTMMSLAACGSSGDSEEAASPDVITVTDHADNQVEVPAKIDKIAVCDIFPLPSVLAVFFDSADKIVGMPEPSMTAAQNGLLGQLYPEILNAETGYIDGTNVNMEELAALEPDVVFYSASSPELGDQLRDAGFAAVAISVNKWDYNCIETLNNWIDLLSQMFPESDKAELCRTKSEEMYSLVQDRVKDIPDEEKANAFFLFQYSDTTLLTSGQQFFGQWWADAIGAKNVAQELSTDNSVAVNMEQVYSWNPDLIFMTNFNTFYPDDLYNNTVGSDDWSTVKAVQNHEVYKMPLGTYRTYTPGVDTPMTLQWLAQKAYPEIFGDIDLAEEVREYYNKLYGITVTDEQIEAMYNPAKEAGFWK